MYIIINTLIIFIVFIIMEFIAWWSHKYIMHGILWILHKDHHIKKEIHAFERNDIFALIFALPSIFLILVGIKDRVVTIYFWIGLGIALYGAAYFIVHDIYIHRRIKIFSNMNYKYLTEMRLMHKRHHKSLDKENSECFGFLWVPKRFRNK